MTETKVSILTEACKIWPDILKDVPPPTVKTPLPDADSQAAETGTNSRIRAARVDSIVRGMLRLSECRCCASTVAVSRGRSVESPRAVVCAPAKAKYILSVCARLRPPPASSVVFVDSRGASNRFPARWCVFVGASYLRNRLSLRADMCSYLPRCKHFPQKATFCVCICFRLVDCYFSPTPIGECTPLRQLVQFYMLYNEDEADMQSPSSTKSPNVLLASRDPT